MIISVILTIIFFVCVLVSSHKTFYFFMTALSAGTYFTLALSYLGLNTGIGLVYVLIIGLLGFLEVIK